MILINSFPKFPSKNNNNKLTTQEARTLWREKIRNTSNFPAHPAVVLPRRGGHAEDQRPRAWTRTSDVKGCPRPCPLPDAVLITDKPTNLPSLHVTRRTGRGPRASWRRPSSSRRWEGVPFATGRDFPTRAIGGGARERGGSVTRTLGRNPGAKWRGKNVNIVRRGFLAQRAAENSRFNVNSWKSRVTGDYRESNESFMQRTKKEQDDNNKR